VQYLSTAYCDKQTSKQNITAGYILEWRWQVKPTLTVNHSWQHSLDQQLQSVSAEESVQQTAHIIQPNDK